ncbi:hypothetical protein Nmel_003826 [Mimus melanotis]
MSCSRIYDLKYLSALGLFLMCKQSCKGLHVQVVNKFSMLTLLRTVNFHIQQLRHTASLHTLI